MPTVWLLVLPTPPVLPMRSQPRYSPLLLQHVIVIGATKVKTMLHVWHARKVPGVGLAKVGLAQTILPPCLFPAT